MASVTQIRPWPQGSTSVAEGSQASTHLELLLQVGASSPQETQPLQPLGVATQMRAWRACANSGAARQLAPVRQSAALAQPCWQVPTEVLVAPMQSPLWQSVSTVQLLPVGSPPTSAVSQNITGSSLASGGGWVLPAATSKGRHDLPPHCDELVQAFGAGLGTQAEKVSPRSPVSATQLEPVGQLGAFRSQTERHKPVPERAGSTHTSLVPVHAVLALQNPPVRPRHWAPAEPTSQNCAAGHTTPAHAVVPLVPVVVEPVVDEVVPPVVEVVVPPVVPLEPLEPVVEPEPADRVHWLKALQA